ncbi:ABC transporter ATP-binding protein [Pseudorhodoferax sp. Leaf265]|uniref:ABC transporter ATP-binding protein n=1 Tax=Pseudorhodoferax sp. Leaf265 TaxID=1736315 RepID=UPI0006FF6332|nr:dipeptide ABC transporter ATP-binding protein [Pseudorhodoferax sp. Leaf265]KQP06383.1 microcin ABC transporter ATP-binding protein [Pseudorhodoferax sp. Leaf265]PZQ03358.1 MAG: ABC transporter ATP-binding protein [Variovorax paradoxus]PZQ17632.1 MAG: ABC transporter ATP-binding protein [Variovorax paradoxus]
MTQPLLLNAKQLQVSFGGHTVVHGVDFALAPGEKLALVGESGSGKTVTALSLLRLVPDAQVAGQALFQSRAGWIDLVSLPERDLRAIRGQEIAMIFQEPMTALNPLYTVGEQIAEVLQLKQGLLRGEAWREAVRLLGDTGIPEPERRAGTYPHQLSGGQRQRAMIAMALACKPALLLADEPTTALDVTLRGQILDLLSELQRKNGMAVLLITHDLNLVRRFADRVAVMEAGHIVEQGAVEEVFAQPKHPYTRRLIDSRPQRDVQEAPAEGAPVLRAGGMRVSYPVVLPGIAGWFRKGRFEAVKGADFAVPPGRTLGVIGESGSGKSTLALAALGLLPFKGQLEVAGGAWGGGRRAELALRRAVQVVFQDPFSSLSPRMTIEEIVGEGLRVHAPELTPEQRRPRVQAALADVGMRAERFPGLLQRYPHEFSGGQRQRIAIARALIVEPQLLVLDEPTSALDVTIQKQVLELLQKLQRSRGLAYLLITHDVDVVRAMAHEVIVMKDGAIVESGPAGRLLDHPEHPYTRSLVAAAAPVGVHSVTNLG